MSSCVQDMILVCNTAAAACRLQLCCCVYNGVSCLAGCRDKTVQAKSGSWGRWGKKLIVGGACVGVGILMAATSRRK